MDDLEVVINIEKKKLNKMIEDNNFQLLDESILIQSRKVDELIFLYILLNIHIE
ncbi:MAG: hypothetical protein AB6733_05555 [Clostridiaceae bacterium]